jgi:hypothetical protein
MVISVETSKRAVVCKGGRKIFMADKKYNHGSATKEEKQKTPNVGRSITEKDNTQQSRKPEKEPAKIHNHGREDNRDLDENADRDSDHKPSEDGIKRVPRNTIPAGQRGSDGNQVDKDEMNPRQHRGNR